MSSQPSSNENLSAYFDHEVSPEERRELESLLEHSAAAREELHEFGELSRLLQETATESAPPELAASIRRRIEQETLLTETTPATVKRAPSMLRYRIAVAISACSSVAALVLFILLMNIPDPTRQFSTADRPLSQSPAPSEHESILFSQEKTPADDYPVALKNSVSPDQRGKPIITAAAPPVALRSANLPVGDAFDRKAGGVMTQPQTRRLDGNFSITNSLAENKVAEKLSGLNLPVEPHPASGIPSHIPVDSIRIGDAFPYFHDIDGKVAVIEVRVVDVKRALGTMELLLARNNIPVNQQRQSDIERQLQRTQTTRGKATGKANLTESDNTEHELFAVYVEATDTQLASAMQDFQKDLEQNQLLGLALQPAINESSLTEAVEELPQILAYQPQSVKAEAKKDNVKESRKLTFNDQTDGVKSLEKGSPTKKLAVADVKQKSVENQSKMQRSYQNRYRMQ
ncbi:MAG: hypothetical protein KDA77_14300, partial [Planctomycetaceae bacterium]|nr:hypothetical protein [Planctomycetaceae bacterium]